MKSFFVFLQKRMMLTFLLLLVSISPILAQVDSSFVQGVGNFIGSIFGQKAGETIVAVIFKILGALVVLDGILALILTFIPTNTPTSMLLTKFFNFLQNFVGGDKKSTVKGGGNW